MSKEKESKSTENTALQQQKNITDSVQARINEMTDKGELVIPSDYSPENALKTAWLVLQTVEDKDHNLALNTCSKSSIANCLLDMVVQGLSPQKKQCYFIPCGKELTLMRSYFGTMTVARRFSDVRDVFANCIYEKDEFDFEIDPMTGLKRIAKHKSSLANIDNTKIVGAYAVVHRCMEDDPYVEIMTMEQIRKAWEQGPTKGNSPAHKNFPEEMSKKTAINRALKTFINSSSDNPVLVEAFNRTSESDISREQKQYYDSGADVIIDVEEQKTTQQTAAAIFGDAESKDDNSLTDEEKAAIEASEAAEAGEQNGSK